MKKVIFFFLMFSNSLFSQTTQELEDIGLLIDDALFYSDRFLTPAADAAIYQISSGWMHSAKKRPLWDVTIGVHANAFFIPNTKVDFAIKNEDFSFFTIEGATTATVPTAMGNANFVYLVGELGSGATAQPVRLRTPLGIDQRVVLYPNLIGSVSLWHGTELLVKYIPKLTLKGREGKGYGFGFKHNLDQYFKSLQAHKINLSSIIVFSNEAVDFDFLDIQTSLGNLGINKMAANVNTYQFQFGVSKDYNKFEIITGIIANRSDIRYRLSGEKGQIENVIPLQSIVNDRLREIYKTKYNYLGEVSCRYKINKMYVQTTLAFGKYVNTNMAFQYEF
jgi:hypothetical protein